MFIHRLQHAALTALLTVAGTTGNAQQLDAVQVPTGMRPLLQVDAAAEVRAAAAVSAPRLSARPNVRSAAVDSARLRMTNVKVRQRPKLLGVVIGYSAGVRQLNGAAGGMLEPGGDYEFGGSGFGTGTGSVFLRHQGRTIPMRVTHWSDSQIFASVPDDVTGLPDARSIELAVGPLGKPALISKRFGFRAARADLPMTVTDDMFAHEPGRYTRIASIDIPTNIAPTNKAFKDGTYFVTRYVNDRGGSKRCFEPGVDRIRFDVPLNPGFEISSAHFSHIAHNRGGYAMNWEGTSLRIDYGVQRSYTPRFVAVGGDGSCDSHYSVRVTVTGPRGIPMR